MKVKILNSENVVIEILNIYEESFESFQNFVEGVGYSVEPYVIVNEDSENHQDLF